MKTITIGAGCFWGVEEDMRALPGVIDAEVGYAGGTVPNPSYELVCSGTTEHAEVVRATYDENVTSYRAIVEAFFAFHDPTTLNQQGPDYGTQYRSIVFYQTDEERQQAEEVKALVQEKLGVPVVTEIIPLASDGEVAGFWRAEEYHQRYVAKKGGKVC